MNKWLSLLLLLASTPALSGQDWVPVDCSSRMNEIQQLWRLSEIEGEVQAEWKKRLDRISAAEAGSVQFIPKPFPKSRDQILENFRYFYFDKLFDQAPGSLPESEKAIYRGLQEQTVEIRTARVVNWGLSRCDGAVPAPYFHLLRLYDRKTGRELSRFVLKHTGMMAVYGHVTPLAESEMPDLSSLGTLLRDRFGFTGRIERPQYVTADGLPFPCSSKLPCISFQSGGQTYLLGRGAHLYEIGQSAARKSVLRRRQELAEAGLQALGRQEVEKPFVTIGFEWVQARRVASRT